LILNGAHIQAFLDKMPKFRIMEEDGSQVNVDAHTLTAPVERQICLTNGEKTDFGKIKPSDAPVDRHISSSSSKNTLTSYHSEDSHLFAARQPSDIIDLRDSSSPDYPKSVVDNSIIVMDDDEEIHNQPFPMDLSDVTIISYPSRPIDMKQLSTILAPPFIKVCDDHNSTNWLLKKVKKEFQMEPVPFGGADIPGEIEEVRGFADSSNFELPDFNDGEVAVQSFTSNFSSMLPHLRECCTFLSFSKNDDPDSHYLNLKFCSSCFCYVCEVNASDCKDWSIHCDAFKGEALLFF
jgi:hypothetical protein